jgi:hypothetical protein
MFAIDVCLIIVSEVCIKISPILQIDRIQHWFFFRNPNLKLAIRKLIYKYQLVKSHLNLML